MAYKDPDGKPLVEKIRDSAGQKGTGKWTAISALDKGMPVTLIGQFEFKTLMPVTLIGQFEFKTLIGH